MTATNNQDAGVLSSCCSVARAREPTDTSITAGDSGSCCTVGGAESQRPEALEAVKDQKISSEIAALRSAGFGLLLDEGRPIEIAEWAAAAGLDEDTVADALKSHEGRVQLDDSGRLLGIAGLTIEPGRHTIEFAGKKRWTWCALDAVGILGALEETGSIRSTDPRSGDAVQIHFVDGRSQGDATLFILGGYDGDNVREEWCPLVNFFSSRGDAEAWVAENAVHGDVVSVADVAQDAAAMWRPVVDLKAPQVC